MQVEGILAGGDVGADDVGGQDLLHLFGAEFLQPTLYEGAPRRPHRADPILRKVQLAVAKAHPDQHLVVAELGRLDVQPHAVLEAHLGDAEVGDLLPLGDFSWRPEFGVGPGLQLVGDSGLQRLGAGVGIDLGQSRFAAVDGLWRAHEQQGALAAEHLARGGRDLLGGEALHLGLEERKVGCGGGEHFFVVQGVDDGVGQAGRAAGGRSGHGGLQLDSRLHDLAIDLVLPHAELSQPALLVVCSEQGRAPLVRLGRH